MIATENNTQWTFDNIGVNEYEINSDEYTVIASTKDYRITPTKEDAEYIVKACNEYPKLIDFLERLEAMTLDGDMKKAIRHYLTSNNIW